VKSAESWARLREVPLFAALPDDGLRRLWQASVPRRYDRGEVLRAQGEPAEHPCALDKVALLDGAGHTATFTALTPCAVRAVPRPRFIALLDDSTAVRAHVLRLLAAQARAQQHRLTDAATLPCEARLAAWLLDTATADGQVALDGSQRDLADLLGVTRVTVNRALSRLRHDGLIAGPEAGRIKLLAPELLALRAGRGGG
jgi:CRP-like cAMP-binding protein